MKVLLLTLVLVVATFAQSAPDSLTITPYVLILRGDPANSQYQSLKREVLPALCTKYQRFALSLDTALDTLSAAGVAPSVAIRSLIARSGDLNVAHIDTMIRTAIIADNETRGRIHDSRRGSPMAMVTLVLVALPAVALWFFMSRRLKKKTPK